MTVPRGRGRCPHCSGLCEFDINRPHSTKCESTPFQSCPFTHADTGHNFHTILHWPLTHACRGPRHSGSPGVLCHIDQVRGFAHAVFVVVVCFSCPVIETVCLKGISRFVDVPAARSFRLLWKLMLYLSPRNDYIHNSFCFRINIWLHYITGVRFEFICVM